MMKRCKNDEPHERHYWGESGNFDISLEVEPGGKYANYTATEKLNYWRCPGVKKSLASFGIDVVGDTGSYLISFETLLLYSSWDLDEIVDAMLREAAERNLVIGSRPTLWGFEIFWYPEKEVKGGVISTSRTSFEEDA